MKTINDILQTEYSEQADKIRKSMVAMSFYKYGAVKDNVRIHKTVETIKSLEKRLEAYKTTGNTEFLLDVMNFAMFEFMYPQKENAEYKPTDSRESPGIVGFGVNEIEL